MKLTEFDPLYNHKKSSQIDHLKINLDAENSLTVRKESIDVSNIYPRNK
jgi:hypothetical protein